MSVHNDARSSSYSEDPITISIQPPSAFSPVESERPTPLSPFPPQHLHEAQDRSIPQASSSRRTSIVRASLVPDYFNAGPALENGGPSSSNTTRQITNEEPSSAGLRSENDWAIQTIHSPYSPAPRFTAIDPFAHKKHRLSWSSILSVKDGGRKRQDNSAPDAWTSPLPHTESDDQPPEFYEDDRPSRETLPYPEQAPAHRHRHSTQTPLPTSFPISESHINSDYESDHDSTSSRSSDYYSLDEGKGRKSEPHQPTQPTAIPTLRFGPQPTNTTLGSVGPSEKPSEKTSVWDLFAKYFPARAYLYVLLGLPGLYFSRVATIFEDANLSTEKMKLMILNNEGAKIQPDLFSLRERDPAFKRLTKSWKHFIDTVIREWKTLNLISVLLLSAIVAILQIESAFSDPVVHYSALYSLICALLSLLFGCMYILRFNTMRLPHKAIQWAHETQKENASRFWNVWILLAIPAVWLVWSLVFYLVCIMAFVWRVESQKPPLEFPKGVILAIRIGISVALCVGLSYGIVVLRTFINFGSPMDARFREQVNRWVEQKANKSHKRPPSMYNVGLGAEGPPRSRQAPLPDHRNVVLPGRPNVVSEPYQPQWTQFQPNAQFYSHSNPPSVYPHSRRSSGASLNVVQPAGNLPPFPLPLPTYPPQTAVDTEPDSPHVRFRAVTQSDMMPPEVKPNGSWQRSPEPTSKTPRSRPSRRQLISSTASGDRRRPPELLLTAQGQDGEPSPPSGPFSNNGTGNRLAPDQLGVTASKELGTPTSPSSGRPPSERLKIPLTIHEDSEAGEKASESPVKLPRSSSPSPSASESVISFNLDTGDPSYCLLNLAPFPVVYEGLEYPTAEHLFQAMRFIEQYPQIAEQVRKHDDLRGLRSFAEGYARQYGRTDWEDLSLVKLEEVLMLKFRQHLELKHFLLGTETRLLVYSDEQDETLGSGVDRRGRNEFGKALMKVRERLRQEPVDLVPVGGQDLGSHLPRDGADG